MDIFRSCVSSGWMTGGARSRGRALCRGDRIRANFTTLAAASRQSDAPFFLVQTNYDRDAPDPPGDDRRTVCERTLAQYGQGAAGSALGVYAAMSTYNVHNAGTAYTAIMCAATGELHSFVRVAMVPVGA